MNKFAILMLVATTQAVKMQAASKGPLDHVMEADPELVKEIESHVHDDPELIAVLEEHKDEIAQWIVDHKDDDKAVNKLKQKLEEHLHE